MKQKRKRRGPYRISKTREAILLHGISCARQHRDITYRDVRAATGLAYRSAHAIVALMAADGQLERVTIKKHTIIKVLKNIDGSDFVPPVMGAL